MNSKPILLVAGEPNSIFLEILFKTYRKKKIKKPLILICSFKLLNLQMKKLNFKKKVRILEFKKINYENISYRREWILGNRTG